jgi:hypothetical protein
VCARGIVSRFMSSVAARGTRFTVWASGYEQKKCHPRDWKERKTLRYTGVNKTISLRGCWRVTVSEKCRSLPNGNIRRMPAVPGTARCPCIVGPPRQCTPLVKLRQAYKMHIISPATVTSSLFLTGLQANVARRRRFADAIMEAGSNKETRTSAPVPLCHISTVLVFTATLQGHQRSN